jgi:hypothetical protein
MVETLRIRCRKVTTIKKNCVEYPVYRGEFSPSGGLAAEIRGQLSTKRKVSTVNRAFPAVFLDRGEFPAAERQSLHENGLRLHQWPRDLDE